jgi:hypothetical protein
MGCCCCKRYDPFLDELDNIADTQARTVAEIARNRVLPWPLSPGWEVQAVSEMERHVMNIYKGNIRGVRVVLHQPLRLSCNECGATWAHIGDWIESNATIHRDTTDSQEKTAFWKHMWRQWQNKMDDFLAEWHRRHNNVGEWNDEYTIFYFK